MISFLEHKALAAHEIFACDLSAERRNALKRQLGVNVYSAPHTFLETMEAVFLCVKPQDLDRVLDEIEPLITSAHLVFSIVAGRRLGGLESRLPAARLVRVMPNMPCQVSAGMSVFCLGARCGGDDEKTTERLLACLGKVLQLPEERFDAVTALSGSGPAFFAYVMEAMVKAGVQEGLDRSDAVQLCEQTMFGAARLMMDRGIGPHDLMQAVASPQGTTAAGLAVLEDSALSLILQQAVAAAARRSHELSG